MIHQPPGPFPTPRETLIGIVSNARHGIPEWTRERYSWGERALTEDGEPASIQDRDDDRWNALGRLQKANSELGGSYEELAAIIDLVHQELPPKYQRREEDCDSERRYAIDDYCADHPFDAAWELLDHVLGQIEDLADAAAVAMVARHQ